MTTYIYQHQNREDGLLGIACSTSSGNLELRSLRFVYCFTDDGLDNAPKWLLINSLNANGHSTALNPVTIILLLTIYCVPQARLEPDHQLQGQDIIWIIPTHPSWRRLRRLHSCVSMLRSVSDFVSFNDDELFSLKRLSQDVCEHEVCWYVLECYFP